MTRPMLALLVVLTATGAQACAVAEGCPVYEEPAPLPDCATGAETGDACVRRPPEPGPIGALAPIVLVIGAILALAGG